MIAYKLLRLRKDGTLGSLFVNAKRKIRLNEWMEAEPFIPKKLQFRPGWHCLRSPYAPHLSEKGRVWCQVEIEDVQSMFRPKSQGGLWYLAKRMRVIGTLSGQEPLLPVV